MGKRSRRRAASASAAEPASTSPSTQQLAELADLVDLTGLSESAGRIGAADLTGAPVEYTDPDGNVLALRVSFPPAARREYMETLSGERGRAATTREDAWQRASELLFERLAARWRIAGAPAIERPRELLLRYRAASAQERAWVRDVLREHCAEHFPDVRAP